MIDADRLRARFESAAPNLWSCVSNLTEEWLRPTISFLDTSHSNSTFPKTFNDPIWGVIELFPWEVVILDSQLLQRLRGVRQLGMAHYVYPGAGYDRLEHSRGVVQAAQEMIDALTRNAVHRQKYGEDADDTVPLPSEIDTTSIRLAALLHDVGHAPFSHTLEQVVQGRYDTEFRKSLNVLREDFEGVTSVDVFEILSVLMVMSRPMKTVFEHPKLGASNEAANLAPFIAAHIVGSRSCLKATYLSGVVSGPLDADKLDYMARDSHHAGLPVGLDLKRLISKLEVVTITPDNAINPELRKRASESPNNRILDIGISLAGLGAYEQMIIGRVILYDRLYYHHKVRAAEAMIRKLLLVAEEEAQRPITLLDLFRMPSDDATIQILSGEFTAESILSGKAQSRQLGKRIFGRRLYYRAFAFASRFIGGIAGLPEKEQKDTSALLWSKVLTELCDLAGTNTLALDIYGKAKLIAENIDALKSTGEELRPEDVLVDLPVNKVIVRGGEILTRTSSGQFNTPNLFFDPEKWSKAYEHQKHCGYVFAPKKFIPLIALASRIVFFEQFQIVMNPVEERASKTVGAVRKDWITKLAQTGTCSAECKEALIAESPRLAPIRPDELRLPSAWLILDPTLPRRLSEGLQDILTAGLPATLHDAVIDGIEHLTSFIDVIEKGGKFVGSKTFSEKDLQNSLKDHLRSRQTDIQEGTEIGGGETDLVLPGPLIIENKARDETADPFSSGPHYVWQGRRYSVAVCSNVVFVVVGYKPATEAAILPLPQRIQVVSPENGPETCAQIRIVIPWSYPPPSLAKAP